MADPLKFKTPAGSHCRDCGEPITWERGASGQSFPVDRDPVAHGTVELRKGVAHFVTDAALPLFSEPRYTDHRKTCVKAKQIQPRAQRRQGAV